MAKIEKKVNKAAMIREYFGQQPNATNREVQEALAKKGIKVSYNQVYFIKMKGKAKKRKKRREAVMANAASMGLVIPAVVEVKALAARLGGMKNLKQLVDLLSE